MQVTPLWQKFKQLGLLDRQLIALQEAHAELRSKIQHQRKTIAEREALLDRMNAAHKKIVHEVSLREAEVAAALSKLTAKEKQAEEAQNSKQQTALAHEISVLKKNCNDLEDICLASLTELEEINKFLTHDAPPLQEQLLQNRADLASLELELEAATAAAISSKNEQDTIISSITPEWFSKYQEMKKRVADPIAPVVCNTCGACFYEVLAQDLVRLKNNAILPCHSCFRLLYCEPDEQVQK